MPTHAHLLSGANTSGVTGVNGCLDFDAVAVDAVGNYVLEVASALPTQSVGLVRVEFLVVGGPISVGMFSFFFVCILLLLLLVEYRS